MQIKYDKLFGEYRNQIILNRKNSVNKKSITETTERKKRKNYKLQEKIDENIC